MLDDGGGAAVKCCRGSSSDPEGVEEIEVSRVTRVGDGGFQVCLKLVSGDGVAIVSDEQRLVRGNLKGVVMDVGGEVFKVVDT